MKAIRQAIQRVNCLRGKHKPSPEKTFCHRDSSGVTESRITGHMCECCHSFEVESFEVVSTDGGLIWESYQK